MTRALDESDQLAPGATAQGCGGMRAKPREHHGERSADRVDVAESEPRGEDARDLRIAFLAVRPHKLDRVHPEVPGAVRFLEAREDQPQMCGAPRCHRRPVHCA
ncbi:MAG: hypothetical protein U0166_12150 [Acidobacteriota bacterium]